MFHTDIIMHASIQQNYRNNIHPLPIHPLVNPDIIESVESEDSNFDGGFSKFPVDPAIEDYSQNDNLDRNEWSEIDQLRLDLQTLNQSLYADIQLAGEFLINHDKSIEHCISSVRSPSRQYNYYIDHYLQELIVSLLKEKREKYHSEIKIKIEVQSDFSNIVDASENIQSNINEIINILPCANKDLNEFIQDNKKYSDRPSQEFATYFIEALFGLSMTMVGFSSAMPIILGLIFKVFLFFTGLVIFVMRLSFSMKLRNFEIKSAEEKSKIKYAKNLHDMINNVYSNNGYASECINKIKNKVEKNKELTKKIEKKEEKNKIDQLYINSIYSTPNNSSLNLSQYTYQYPAHSGASQRKGSVNSIYSESYIFSPAPLSPPTPLSPPAIRMSNRVNSPAPRVNSPAPVEFQRQRSASSENKLLPLLPPVNTNSLRSRMSFKFASQTGTRRERKVSLHSLG